MNNNVARYRIFLASPGDLSTEREVVAEVVNTINLEYGRNMNCYLELINWETGAAPGIGEDAQEVINRDLSEEYQVFIGLMWTRLGTPTSRAGSGTEEEFDRAVAKYKSDPDNVRVMFYFKTAPVPFDKIDTVQIEKVREFKDDFKNLGLYWEFSTEEELRTYLRLHLIKQLLESEKKTSGAPKREAKSKDLLSQEQPMSDSVGEASSTDKEAIDREEEEKGYFELITDFHDKISQGNDALVKMSDAINVYSENLQSKTGDLRNIGSLETASTAKVATKIIDAVANDSDELSGILQENIPVLASSFRESSYSFIQMLALSRDFEQADEGEFEYLLGSLETMNNNTKSAKESMVGFRENVTRFPRATAKMNKAKRVLVDHLDDLTRELDTIIQLNYEMIRNAKAEMKRRNT